DPLELDTRLQAAGRWFANDLALNGITNIGNPHEDSDGHDPGYRLTAQGYTWTSYGETIALGTEDFADTPEEAVQGWMSSPPHKAILLGSYEHVGIGHKFLEEYPSTGEWENAWVADFANTAGARSAPPANCDPGYHENFFPFVGK
ncbi:MAG: CAP domain-containing protein, partial [Gemmatimonadota bacterium]